MVRLFLLCASDDDWNAKLRVSVTIRYGLPARGADLFVTTVDRRRSARLGVPVRLANVRRQTHHHNGAGYYSHYISISSAPMDTWHAGC